MKLYKRIYLLALSCAMIIVLSACGEQKVPESITQGISKQFLLISEHQDEMLGNLYSTGLLSDDSYNEIHSEIMEKSLTMLKALRKTANAIDEFSSEAKIDDNDNEISLSTLKDTLIQYISKIYITPMYVKDEDGTISENPDNTVYLSNYMIYHGKDLSRNGTVTVVSSSGFPESYTDAEYTDANGRLVEIDNITLDEIKNKWSNTSDGIYMTESDKTDQSYKLSSFKVSSAYDGSNIKKSSPAIVYVSDQSADLILTQLNYNLYVLRDDNSEEYDIGTVSTMLQSGDYSSISKYFKDTGKKAIDTMYASEITMRSDADINQTSTFGGKYHTFAVRMQGFNETAVNKLINALQLGSYSDSNKFVVVKNGVNKGIYLMEYPVYYVDGFEVNETDAGLEYKPIIKMSDLRLNIKTGNVAKQVGIKRWNGSFVTSSSDIVKSEGDNLYKIGKSGESSFMIYGNIGDDKGNPNQGDLIFSVKDSYTEKDAINNVPRILLMDYLEAVYSPGVISYTDSLIGKTLNEQIVAYGRMIRLRPDALSNVYDSQSPVIGDYIVPATGNKVDPAIKVRLSDLADVIQMCGAESYPDRGIINRQVMYDSDGDGIGDTIADNDHDGYPDTESVDFGYNPIVMKLRSKKSEQVSFLESENNRRHKDAYATATKFTVEIDKDTYLDKTKHFDKVDELPIVVSEVIRSTIRFPGGSAASLNENGGSKSINMLYTARDASIYGTLDFAETYSSNYKDIATENDKPIMYAMTVNTNLGANGLVRYLVREDSNYSLSWWVKWLKDHNFSYGNMLNNSVANLNTLLRKNYQNELAGEGIGLVVINLDTIKRINDDFQIDKQKEIYMTVRTIFKVLGYIMVGYSIILVLAWAMDTNLDLGLDILNKLTFHSMYATSSESDIPDEYDYGYDYGSTKVRYVGLYGIVITSLIILTIGVVLVFVDVITIVTGIVEMFVNLIKWVQSIIGG